ncbi:hypothetical protein GGF46_004694 [Coemansia sp. RSA 552]|nr:hypothetical protein GGF46_004694 [Coemansia sp. RSA 552]
MPIRAASLVLTAPVDALAGRTAAASADCNYGVLLVRRVSRHGGAFNGALVFPGGVEEPADHGHAAACAVRETREETGLCLESALMRVVPLARWVTPRAQRRRFDTRFMLLSIRPQDHGILAQLGSEQLQSSELVQLDWLTPDQALRANARRQLPLLPPQAYFLNELARVRQWQDLGRLCAGAGADRPVETLLCRRSDGRSVALLPGDHAYPADMAAASVDDQALFGSGAPLHRLEMDPATDGGFHELLEALFVEDMRLPFSRHKTSKSSDGFVQLGGERAAPSPSARNRGASVSSMASASSSGVGITPMRGGSRPVSLVYGAHSPSAELQLAQIEEELDTLMDAMGLEGDRRLAIKNIPLDSKVQLIHTHKMKQTRDEVHAQRAPLSEHLAILQRAGTQSLPRARLERLRVDLSSQGMGQISAFIEEGGLRLLLGHLAQLNERRTANRRIDELLKELELLRCILAVAKVADGARYLVDSATNVRRILDSLGTLWLPCAIMSLRIASCLAQQESHEDAPDMHCVRAILASLFRRDSANNAAPETPRRSPPFDEWMDSLAEAIGEYGLASSGSLSASVPAPMPNVDQSQTRADIVDYVSASLTLINSIVDAMSSSLDRRVKFYEKLAGRGLPAKLHGLRAWKVPIIESHLSRWDEASRRDYNLARSQKQKPLVLGSTGDSSIRNTAVFSSFVAHYEEAKAAASGPGGGASSDDDEEYLQMNLAMFSGDTKPREVLVSASAPVTPRMGLGPAPPSAGAPPKNPFLAARDSPADPAPEALASAQTAVDLGDDHPFGAHSRSGSASFVAETGCLRSLRSPGKEPAEAPIAGIRAACALLQKSLRDSSQLSARSARTDLQAIVEMAQLALAALPASNARPAA